MNCNICMEEIKNEFVVTNCNCIRHSLSQKMFREMV